MPYLKVANHGEASSADPASGQPQGVEEGWPQALQEVGVAQQSHQDDCGRETQPCNLPLSAPLSSHSCPVLGWVLQGSPSQPCFPGSRHLPMKEPRLQMRLKKQLSGGRVPHLLWGQTRPTKSSDRVHWGVCSPPAPGHPPGLSWMGLRAALPMLLR